MKIYEVIARRFLSIFYPAAIYQKYALELTCGQEHFFTSFRVLTEQGYLKVAEVPKRKKADDTAASGGQVPACGTFYHAGIRCQVAAQNCDAAGLGAFHGSPE